MSKPTEYNVTVLSRRETTTYPKIGVAVEITRTTYVAAGLPPRSIEIPKAEWTKEKEAKLIRADIEKRLKEKTEAFKV